MNELKFRVFDKSDNTIITWDDMVDHLPQDFLMSAIVYNKENMVVEQFTGLYDRNGVAIYCGDICVDHIGFGVVEFNEKYAAFRMNYQDGKCKWFYDYTLRGERKSIEVLGNIHANPELLEAT